MTGTDSPGPDGSTTIPDGDATADAPPPRISLLVLPGTEDELIHTRASLEAQSEGPWELLETGPAADAPANTDTADDTIGADDEDAPPLPPRHPDLPAAAAAARGEWIGVLGAGDSLEPGVLATILSAIDAAPDVRVVHADERLPDGRTHAKPSWMPRALEQLDVLGRLTLVRADLMAEVGGLTDEEAAEWDLHLRLAEHLGAGDPLAPSPDVLHLPLTSLARATDPADLLDAGAAAVERSLARRGSSAVVVRPHATAPDSTDEQAPVDTAPAPPPSDHLVLERPLPRTPRVSVVIPTGGGHRETPAGTVRSVDVVLETLLARTDYPDYDVVVVTSEGTEAGVAEDCRALDPRVSVVEAGGPFNFSRSINAGVGAASGELVLLLNDDAEIVDPTWLRDLVAIGLEDGIGAVGARLLYGDGTIQHAGIVMSADRTPSHLLAHEPDGVPRLGVGSADLEHLAVTAACLLTPRAAFEQVGGLSEELPLSYNDVDYCLKLRTVGLRTVCAGGVRVIHHESVTRDATVTDREHAAVTWWSGITALDPWYWGV
ncbi:glycosyltransferase family 2 protein [Georgenia sp. Z1491]|uniref:glycosyltransferase family 2 protein n=1 Tax=Georgenia sp. Z1491 TaxID=3416707 RepID=UPI003CF06E31